MDIKNLTKFERTIICCGGGKHICQTIAILLIGIGLSWGLTSWLPIIGILLALCSLNGYMQSRIAKNVKLQPGQRFLLSTPYQEHIDVVERKALLLVCKDAKGHVFVLPKIFLLDPGRFIRGATKSRKEKFQK